MRRVTGLPPSVCDGGAATLGHGSGRAGDRRSSDHHRRFSCQQCGTGEAGPAPRRPRRSYGSRHLDAVLSVASLIGQRQTVVSCGQVPIPLSSTHFEIENPLSKRRSDHARGGLAHHPMSFRSRPERSPRSSGRSLATTDLLPRVHWALIPYPAWSRRATAGLSGQTRYRNENLMKPQASKALTLLGGATAVVLAAGFGGGGYDKLPTTLTTTTTSFVVAAAPTPPAAPAGPAGPAGPADGRAAVSPSACIVGLNCGPIGPIGPKRPKQPGLLMPQTPSPPRTRPSLEPTVET
jgi:hypothetical protein